jgi:hypothetical protein
MSKHTTPARLLSALNDCKLFDKHQWHRSFIVGQFLCTICGAISYCPDCTTDLPRGKRLRFCPIHRATREAQEPQQKGGVQ